jgi:hypothetical protein
MISVFPQWGFTFIYIRLITSNDVFISTIGLTSITQNIFNNYHINYLLHYISFTLWWGRNVPFTSQTGLQVSLTLGQYSKGSHTPTSAQPLGAHPFVLSHMDVHIFISLCLTGESHSLVLNH